MKQSESHIGQKVIITGPTECIRYIRENHNPKGAGVSANLTTPHERSYFVLWEFIKPARHNPYDFVPGDIVLLDGRHKVRIISMTPLEMYSKVYSTEVNNATEEDWWEVMTSRLTHVKHNQ